ncbi:hypothetical protein M407DRAFT_42295, partial [Tulasnella calospora MUT 4182]
ACTVCRTAKMRCIGGDDQNSDRFPCNRCKKANVQCIFEKHRRGRKPGSKLSEATKARRATKEAAKAVSVAGGPAPYHNHNPNGSGPSSAAPHPLSPAGPPAVAPHAFPGPYAPQYMPDAGSSAAPTINSPVSPSRPEAMARKGSTASGDDEDSRSDENLFPGSMVQRERNRFLSMVLNPPNSGPNHPSRDVMGLLPPCFELPKEDLPDPMDLGILTENDARWLLNQVFQHLNPFVNLFDPLLHTVEYIRSRSPFLFTVLMMAGCKFWKPDLFKPLQKMAYVFAVEVVQAFTCLVYWKEPDDNRTWQFIGYACRLAIELNLNTYTRKPDPKETELQMRERRNRERTYLVLFVHDRSLAMQTGRPWMLQEDDLIRNSGNWHRQARGERRPEDVIVAAFVQLRRLSAETSDVFYLRKNSSRDNSDVNFEVLLNGCNTKLTGWMEFWENEMGYAEGNEFHFCMLRFFRLHVRLFLNSLGLTQVRSLVAGSGFSIQALSLCYTSAKETLQIVGRFKEMEALRFGQDVITVMSA